MHILKLFNNFFCMLVPCTSAPFYHLVLLCSALWLPRPPWIGWKKKSLIFQVRVLRLSLQ